MASVLGLLGVDTGYHPAAALVVDGRVVAFAEEERFTGNKASSTPLPARSIAWCLSEGGLRLGDVDLLAYGWDCRRYLLDMPARMAWHFVRYRSARRRTPRARAGGSQDGLLRGLSFLVVHRPGWVEHRLRMELRRAGMADPVPRIEYYPHHLCHAASAFFCSGMQQAAVLVMDGSGEEVATTAWRGDGLSLEKLWSIDLPHSLGWFYSAFTEYLGFRHSRDEGKVMGLAAYGRPDERWQALMRRIVRLSPDGSYELDPAWGKYGRCSVGEHFSDEVIERFGPPRLPEGPIEQRHKDIAWAAQERLEQAMAGLVQGAIRDAGHRDLCMAGGVAMNCKANGAILRASGVGKLFVQPAADDSGAALGAALLGARDLGDDPRHRQRTAALGPGFSPDQARSALDGAGLGFEEPADLADAVAARVARGEVVGWVQGRLESGSRALGHRSIVALPSDPGMKDRVNLRVKLREPWRPYAPSMTSSGAVELLGEDRDLPFMIVARDVSPAAAARFPSVVHVDGTARPQTVDSAVDPEWHGLIRAVGRHAGSEVVLNTSLNVRGKPIDLGPREALRTFFSTGMDAIAIGPFLVTKDQGKTPVLRARC